jgi:ATP-dependent RNA helicase SUPV3L1/SUV3
MNAKGKPCALVTGEERRIPEGMKNFMSSCTVEMVPLNTKVDVAVIDEIQMLGDRDRGWAWTQAFLGIQAKELHLCGEERTTKLITELCAQMGDQLVVHRYERLSPLQMSPHSLGGSVKKLEKGDAMILFSRLAIHGMKKRIENVTGRRCAVVYGSLPPETRAQQAALFNDPDNDYDFLVASDAVGMGLNLSIKRVIFFTTEKFNGFQFGPIAVPEIKQIAGRAGRYKSARDAIKEGPIDLTDGMPEDVQPPLQVAPTSNRGWIATLEDVDHLTVKNAMETEVEPLKSAGIFPPAHIMDRFASYFPAGTPFSYIILRLHDIAAINPSFHLCDLKEQVEVCDIMQPFNLSVNDRIVFLAAPVFLRDKGGIAVLAELAKCVANQESGHLLDLKSFNLELLDMDKDDHKDGSAGYLREAEVLHKAITLYLWLSYRFGGVFNSQPLAFHVKSLVEAKIDECLSVVEWDEAKMRTQKAMARKALERQMKKLEEALQGTTEEEDSEGADTAALTDDGAIEEDSTDPDPASLGASASVDDPTPLAEDAGNSEDSSASETGVPTSPEEQPPRVINRGPLWEAVSRAPDAVRESHANETKP